MSISNSLFDYLFGLHYFSADLKLYHASFMILARLNLLSQNVPYYEWVIKKHIYFFVSRIHWFAEIFFWKPANFIYDTTLDSELYVSIGLEYFLYFCNLSVLDLNLLLRNLHSPSSTIILFNVFWSIIYCS